MRGAAAREGWGIPRVRRRRASYAGRMTHRIRLVSLSAAAVLVATALSGCVALAGPTATEERAVEDDVRAVVLEAPGGLVVTAGDTASLTVTAGERVLDRLTAESEDGVLVLGHGPGPWFLPADVSWELTLPVLDRIRVAGAGDAEVDFAGADDVVIEIAGAGDVDAAGVDAESVVIDIDGAGDVDLGDVEAERIEVALAGVGDVRAAGEAVEAVVEIDGAGEFDAAGLRVEDARVVIRGAGDVRLGVVRSLDVAIAGAGSVRYSGDPEVTSDIDGAGSVERE